MISFNPMQYVVWRGIKDDYELFSDDNGEVASIPTLTHEQYLKLEDFLKSKDNPVLLPIQIAYYTGLRIGEVCGLTWQDVNLEKQYLVECAAVCALHKGGKSDTFNYALRIHNSELNFTL